MDVRDGKVISYIGFAVKSRKFVRGIYSIKLLKKANLLMVDGGAGNNSLHEAEILAERLKCPLVETAEPLENYTYVKNCKLIAITDENLAKGILNNLGGAFTNKNGGTKNDGKERN